MSSNRLEAFFHSNTGDRIVLNPAARQAIRAFRDAKPWRGTVQERADKFAEFHQAMCRAYDLETLLVRDDMADPECVGTSANSTFHPRLNKIVLRGRLSVVTYLFLLGGALGAKPTVAIRWAHEQFAHFFPRSYAGCRRAGGLLVRA